MNCKCCIVEKVSNKTGNKYKVLIVEFPNGYKKRIFLEEAELFMLEAIL